MGKLDLILKNGYLIDPLSDKEGQYDIGIRDGKVEAVEEEIIPRSNAQVVDVKGNMVMPGLIDTHVHITWGKFGYSMLARAGVTTALDCAGPIEEAVDKLPAWGAGINTAVLNGVIPEETVCSENPAELEIEDFVISSLGSGALGIKIMGGHYPLTPDATHKIIRIANKHEAYVAFHAGTTNKGSNIEGMKEALELADGFGMQLCHINAYCRGLVYGDSVGETQQAMLLLKDEKNKGIVSESHLGPYNGTSGKCKYDKPISHITRTCLKTGGFDVSKDGLKDAILQGYARVNIIKGDAVGYALPEEGYNYWHKNSTDVTVSFPVNKRDTAFLCAVTKDKEGDFVVDALSTDGGSIPRNFLLSKGLLLVKFDAISLKEFVLKTSSIPAKMLGLESKGHLALGADADITVFNLEKEKPIITIVAGNIVMYKGVILESGGTIITTKTGYDELSKRNIPCQVAKLQNSLMYKEKI